MTDDYKSKYDDLMKRCADFMRDFAPPSPYELGFKAGWEAAKQEFHKDNTYVPDTTKQSPIRTMDLQWPRDYPNTTNPWPPNNICSTCRIDLNKATHYVCNHPKCTSQIRWSSAAIVTKGSTT
jgi:hypothetical protein